MLREQIFESSVGYFLNSIGAYLQDDSVTEVMVNRFDQIYIERAGRLESTSARFPSEDALLAAVQNVAQWVGRRIDAKHPILEARLPDGSRVHAIIPPGARGGTCLTIRKFHRGGLRMDDLINYGSISESAREFIEVCVRLRKNTLIAGGTGTGKTSLLGALSSAIPDDERIIVIEDTSELRLDQPHTIYLEVQQGDEQQQGKITIRDLFVASLRMRPDRILVGEVRAGEALDMVQSMLSGHAGSLSTIHAASPRDAVVRLETLSLMSDVELPIYVARAQVASAIHLIIQLERFSEDGSRRVVRITEALGLGDDNQYQLRDLYVTRVTRTRRGEFITNLEESGNLPTFAEEPYERGVEGQLGASRSMWRMPGEAG